MVSILQEMDTLRLLGGECSLDIAGNVRGVCTYMSEDPKGRKRDLESTSLRNQN